MKQGILTLAFLLMISSVHAQFYKKFIFYDDLPMKITFFDGTVIEGEGALSESRTRIRFQGEEGEILYNLEDLDIDKLSITEHDITRDYIFAKPDGYNEWHLLEHLVKGKLNIYNYATTNGDYGPPLNGMPGIRSISGAFDLDHFLLEKSVDGKPAPIIPYHTIRTNFKKNASNFFSDCPELASKIRKKEFKKRDFNEIVVFYNENCN